MFGYVLGNPNWKRRTPTVQQVNETLFVGVRVYMNFQTVLEESTINIFGAKLFPLGMEGGSK